MRQRAFVCCPAISRKSAGVWSAVHAILELNSPTLAAMESAGGGCWPMALAGPNARSTEDRSRDEREGTGWIRLGVRTVSDSESSAAVQDEPKASKKSFNRDALGQVA